MIYRLTMAIGLGVLASCLGGCRVPASRTAGLVAELAPPLEQGPRQSVSVVVPASAVPPLTAPGLYRYLTLDECRRRAFAATPLAGLLTGAAEPDQRPPRKHDRFFLLPVLRAYAADELRNRHIAEALTDFYRLAAVEGQWDRLLQAEELLQQQQRAVEAAVQQGLRPASDRIALHRQMQELRTRQSQLHSARIVLNASLVERLALGQAEPPLWPQTELRLDLREVDAEAAVATAWLYRPDLNVLRLLNQFQHRDREQVQGVIQAIHPLLGIESPRPTLLSRVKLVRLLPNPPEEHWHEQLRALVHSRQQQVASEVRAAIAVRQARRATAVAQQAEVDSWRQQVAELEKRQAVGQAVTAELLTARLELLRAEAALIQAVADWHLADVQLRQSLGLLVRE